MTLNAPLNTNNFVYRISLLSPLDKENGACQSQPGCVAIPSGSSELILRLTNSDATGMGAATRVGNEVAMITLAAAALGPIFKPHVVPDPLRARECAGGYTGTDERTEAGSRIDTVHADTMTY